jgi:hypothetical protein
MEKKPEKPRRRLTSDDSFNLGEAKAHYGTMPSWQRLAIWTVLGLILLGIIGDLVW